MPRSPLDKPVTASGYGWRTIQGKPQGHWGIDVAGKAGAPVFAPESGVVVDVLRSDDPERADNTRLPGATLLTMKRFPSIKDPWDFYGPGIVLIAGDTGAFHLLAHLATQTVAIGDHVTEGAQVGTLATHVGASGTHVHWEVRKHDIDTPDTREGDTFDPIAWLGARPNTTPGTLAPFPVPWPLWVWLLVGYGVGKAVGAW